MKHLLKLIFPHRKAYINVPAPEHEMHTLTLFNGDLCSLPSSPTELSLNFGSTPSIKTLRKIKKLSVVQRADLTGDGRVSRWFRDKKNASAEQQ